MTKNSATLIPDVLFCIKVLQWLALKVRSQYISQEVYLASVLLTFSSPMLKNSSKKANQMEREQTLPSSSEPCCRHGPDSSDTNSETKAALRLYEQTWSSVYICKRGCWWENNTVWPGLSRYPLKWLNAPDSKGFFDYSTPPTSRFLNECEGLPLSEESFHWLKAFLSNKTNKNQALIKDF